MTNIDITELEAKADSKSPRVDALIYQYMVKHPSITTKGQADYYEDVHQGLAPLARELEIELITKDAAILSLIAELEQARKDARRYRFLTENFENNYNESHKTYEFFYNNRGELSGDAFSYATVPTLEDAIDAALSAQEGEGK